MHCYKLYKDTHYLTCTLVIRAKGGNVQSIYNIPFVVCVGHWEQLVVLGSIKPIILIILASSTVSRGAEDCQQTASLLYLEVQHG